MRLAALDAIADIGNLEAGYFLLDVLRRERGPIYERALVRLRSFPMSELAAHDPPPGGHRIGRRPPRARGAHRHGQRPPSLVARPPPNFGL